MSDSKYDKLFDLFILYEIRITILQGIYDELIQIKDKPNANREQKRSAMIGLNRISQLQDNNLVNIVGIGIQVKRKTYADPLIINYVKNNINRSIFLISNDLDVKIRAHSLRGSTNTITLLGKDLIENLCKRRS
jgi:hypothetical protein